MVKTGVTLAGGLLSAVGTGLMAGSAVMESFVVVTLPPVEACETDYLGMIGVYTSSYDPKCTVGTAYAQTYTAIDKIDSKPTTEFPLLFPSQTGLKAVPGSGEFESCAQFWEADGVNEWAAAAFAVTKVEEGLDATVGSVNGVLSSVGDSLGAVGVLVGGMWAGAMTAVTNQLVLLKAGTDGTGLALSSPIAAGATIAEIQTILGEIKSREVGGLPNKLVPGALSSDEFNALMVTLFLTSFCSDIALTAEECTAADAAPAFYELPASFTGTTDDILCKLLAFDFAQQVSMGGNGTNVYDYSSVSGPDQGGLGAFLGSAGTNFDGACDFKHATAVLAANSGSLASEFVPAGSAIAAQVAELGIPISLVNELVAGLMKELNFCAQGSLAVGISKTKEECIAYATEGINYVATDLSKIPTYLVEAAQEFATGNVNAEWPLATLVGAPVGQRDFLGAMVQLTTLLAGSELESGVSVAAVLVGTCAFAAGAGIDATLVARAACFGKLTDGVELKSFITTMLATFDGVIAAPGSTAAQIAQAAQLKGGLGQVIPGLINTVLSPQISGTTAAERVASCTDDEKDIEVFLMAQKLIPAAIALAAIGTLLSFAAVVTKKMPVALVAGSLSIVGACILVGALLMVRNDAPVYKLVGGDEVDGKAFYAGGMAQTLAMGGMAAPLIGGLLVIGSAFCAGAEESTELTSKVDNSY